MGNKKRRRGSEKRDRDREKRERERERKKDIQETHTRHIDVHKKKRRGHKQLRVKTPEVFKRRFVCERRMEFAKATLAKEQLFITPSLQKSYATAQNT